MERDLMQQVKYIANRMGSTLAEAGNNYSKLADAFLKLDNSCIPTKPADVKVRKTHIKGMKCKTCSSMTKKDLKYYDSCPDCGKSLFALKSRGY